MRLSLGQSMQMAQKQVLAPRMIQSMEILQLPIMALQERIEQEMEDNPVLDQIEPTGEEAESPLDATVENPDAPADTEKELVVNDDQNNEDDFERLPQYGGQFTGRLRGAKSSVARRNRGGGRSSPRRHGKHGRSPRIVAGLSESPTRLV